MSRLVILVSERTKYTARDPDLCSKVQKLWEHASATAMAASWLARRLGFRKLEEEAFLGGLMHDVGRLVILRAIDEIKAAGQLPFDFSAQLVDEILDSAHTELGYNLLKKWEIPEVYCRIARDHHSESFDPTDIRHVTVRLVNHATTKMNLNLKPDASVVLIATPEAQCLGVTDIMLAELEIMLEDSFPQPALGA